jgi:hypothetical protein
MPSRFDFILALCALVGSVAADVGLAGVEEFHSFVTVCPDVM